MQTFSLAVLNPFGAETFRFNGSTLQLRQGFLMKKSNMKLVLLFYHDSIFLEFTYVFDVIRRNGY